MTVEIKYIPAVPELSSAESTETAPSREGAEAPAIEIILKSRSFERATASRQLLAYLWTHQGDELSEYTLAVEAMGRRPDFDPKIDATVRVQISRLRQRLHDFYQSYEATLCPVYLTIPVGTHQLQNYAA
jgi:DNA-binding response OmpR family regulator